MQASIPTGGVIVGSQGVIRIADGTRPGCYASFYRAPDRAGDATGNLFFDLLEYLQNALSTRP